MNEEPLCAVAVLGGDFGTYTYAGVESARPGARVLVPFGRQQVVGILLGSGVPAPAGGARLRPVTRVLDPRPAGDETWLRFITWVAAYYLVPPGSVLATALPSSLRVREGARRPRAGAGPRTRTVYAYLGDAPVHARAEVEAAILAHLRHHRGASRRSILARWPRGAPALRRLVTKGALREEEVPEGASAAGMLDLAEAGAVLNPTSEQAAVLEALRAAGDARPVLLQGVTGSGKTEVYLRLAARALEAGGTALIMVPEIGLTPALLARVRARFGDAVAVLHSGLGDAARAHEWWRIRSGRARLVLGVRSAVFAPLGDLRLIVVDEEHDDAYKQERGLRYHARDLALARAQISGALVVLGSATPSVESVAHARAGRYRRFHLRRRATSSALPEVEIVDLRVAAMVSPREAGPAGDGRGDVPPLTETLIAALRKTLDRAEQSIVLLNRRGFAPWVLCTVCGEALTCDHCAVSLAWHRRRRTALCHLCGLGRPMPERCPTCGHAEALELKGHGTESIVDELAGHLPGARIGRLDRDTARGLKGRSLLQSFADGAIDVLVGTQMVAKGHDFPRVTLVGVLLADQGLRVPDFRGTERTFQLLTQVAGRSGRADRPGRVLVQTFAPEHPAIRFAAGHDTDGFLEAELAFRARAGYPPFRRLALLEVRGAKADRVDRRATELLRAAVDLSSPKVEILGPAAAAIPVVRGRYRVHLVLKSTERPRLRDALRALIATGLLKRRQGVEVALDVDPIRFL